MELSMNTGMEYEVWNGVWTLEWNVDRGIDCGQCNGIWKLYVEWSVDSVMEYGS